MNQDMATETVGRGQMDKKMNARPRNKRFLRTVKTGVLIAAAFFIGHVANAEVAGDSSFDKLLDLEFEEFMEIEIPVVESASKFKQRSLDAPASTTVIYGDEIREMGYRTIGELLSTVRGFYLSSDRNYDYLGTRGLSRPGDFNSRIRFLINGFLINDAVYGSAGADRQFPLDVQLIDRVEIIRGPSSSLYGTGAFFGVVNFVTIEGGALDGGEVALSTGRFATHEGRLSLGTRTDGGLDVVASITDYRSDGNPALYYEEFDDPSTNHGVVENADGEDATSIFAMFRYRDFTLQIASADRSRTVPTGSYGTVFPTDRTFTTDRAFNIGLLFQRDLGERTRVSARSWWSQVTYLGEYLYDYSDDGDLSFLVTNRDLMNGVQYGAELSLACQVSDRIRVIGGAEYQNLPRLDQSNRDLELYLDTHDQQKVSALFAAVDGQISDRWSVNFGLRHDDYRTFGGSTNPRIALIWSPDQRSAIKLLYGSAFRAPNAFERSYNDGFNTTKPPLTELQPEEIRTFELIWERFVGDHFSLTATAFDYRIDELIDFAVDPADDLLYFSNLTRVVAHGAEFQVDGSWKNGLNASLALSFQDSEDGLGEELVNSPSVTGVLKLRAPLFEDRLRAALVTRFVEDRRALDGSIGNDQISTDLSLTAREPLPGLDLQFTVYNLFDANLENPGGAEHRQAFIKQDDWTWRLQATVRF